MKAGILEEMVEDTMEGLEGEEEEDAAQEEIDKILLELTAGALGTAPDALKGKPGEDQITSLCGIIDPGKINNVITSNSIPPPSPPLCFTRFKIFREYIILFFFSCFSDSTSNSTENAWVFVML